MNNPWEQINLQDYENHMKLDSVMQLQTMNVMMKRQFQQYPVQSMMILGIAGGNGLEHVPKQMETVYGIDINKSYLAECEKRYPELKNIFFPLCADLTEEKLALPHAELVVANLLIEYIGYECFQNVIKQVEPVYVSCGIQINTDESFVSDSPYIHVFDDLDRVHHQMEEHQLTEAMEQIGYSLNLQEEQILPNGKKLVRLDYVKRT